MSISRSARRGTSGIVVLAHHMSVESKMPMETALKHSVGIRRAEQITRHAEQRIRDSAFRLRSRRIVDFGSPSNQS